jgi:hypothetical protein
LLVAEILQADILRGVVIRVNIIPALQTPELILSVVVWTIILVCKATLRATLARVRRINLLHHKLFRLGFVRIFEQLALLAVYREAGDCRPTHVIVCYIFNVDIWPFGSVEILSK